MFASEVLRIVCISDTHNDNPSPHVQSGDILIHAGDMTDFGSMIELKNAYEWISALPHRVKVVIAGRLQASFL
jgi:3',5'-cyclic AMP phosphodiesterase CpdA